MSEVNPAAFTKMSHVMLYRDVYHMVFYETTLETVSFRHVYLSVCLYTAMPSKLGKNNLHPGTIYTREP